MTKLLRIGELSAQNCLDMVGEIVLALDDRGNVVFINKRGQEVLKYGEGDLIGKNWFEMVVPKNLLKETKNRFFGLMSGKVKPIKKYMIPIMTKNDEEKIIIWSESLIKDDFGSIIGVITTGTDITKLKSKKKAFKMAEYTIDKAKDNIFWFKPSDGTLIYANESACAILGYCQDELTSKNMKDIFLDFEWNNWLQFVKRLRVKKSNKLESIYVTKNGKKIPVELTVYFVELDGEEVIIFYSRNNSGRKLPKNELLKSEEKYRTLVENIGMIISVVDVEARIQFINRGFEKILGYDEEDVRGENIFDFTHPDDFSKLKDAYHVILNGNEVHGIEFRLLHEKGRYIHLISDAVPIHDDGKVHAILWAARDITERKKEEEVLKLDEERLKVLLEISQMKGISENEITNFALEECVTLTKSKVGYLHFFNEDEKTLQLYTWSSAVMKKCTAEKTPHYPLDNAGVWADCVRLRKPVIHNDYQNLKEKKGYPEGHFPITRHMSVPIFDEGKIVAVAGVGNKEEPYDESNVRQIFLFMNSMWRILRQLRAEEALRESEEKYRMLVQNANIIISIIGLNDAFQFINEGFKKILGYSEEDLVGKKGFDLIHEEDILMVKKALRKVIDVTVIRDVEFRTRDKSGQYLYLISNIVPIKDHLGNLTSILWVARDISERKQIEADLYWKNLILEAQAETSIDGILIVDKEGKTILFNNRFKEIWNIPQEILDTRDDERMIRHVLNQLRHPEKFVKKMEYLYLHSNEKSLDQIEFKDGTVFERYSSPLIDAKSSYRGRIWYFHDITPFIELDNLRSQFISTVSHELRTPITAIDLTLKNLQKHGDKIKEDQKERMINMMAENSVILIEMVEDLLLASRIESGRMKLQWEKYKPYEILNNILIQMDASLKEKQITKVIDAGPDIVLNGDAKRIGQVFRVLIDNAIKYSPERTIIRIKIIDNYVGIHNPEGMDGVLIQVIDEGYGIPEKDKPKLISRFFRASNVMNISGTGLGLSIARDLVKLHSGEIHLESKVGKGSTFSVFLPLIN